MEGTNIEKSSQGWYKEMQIGFWDSDYTPGQKFIEFSQ